MINSFGGGVESRHAATPCKHGDSYKEGRTALDAERGYNLSRSSDLPAKFNKTTKRYSPVARVVKDLPARLFPFSGRGAL